MVLLVGVLSGIASASHPEPDVPRVRYPDVDLPAPDSVPRCGDDDDCESVEVEIDDQKVGRFLVGRTGLEEVVIEGWGDVKITAWPYYWDSTSGAWVRLDDEGGATFSSRFWWFNHLDEDAIIGLLVTLDRATVRALR